MSNEHQADAPKPRRKAFSYLRFSTPEQAKGDSRRRQTDKAAQYAAAHGLELDEALTFRDEGKSAYRSAHATEGRLADFLEAVKTGEVPKGSVLLVESLDRISRDKIVHAQALLLSLLAEDITLVTLSNGKALSTEILNRDPFALIEALLSFIRSNEESATKAMRLRAAWEGKRLKIAQGVPLTAKAPAWLRLADDRASYEVIEERAELVRRAFRLTVEGVGQHKIAATFNVEGHQPWGRAKHWHRSYIAKVLASEAVIGRFQPHGIEPVGAKKRRIPIGEPVDGYFPAIITEAMFAEVQALRTAKGAPQRGRHASRPVTHVLAGLATCPCCGSTMTRVQKGKRSRPAYVCSRAKAGGGCVYRSLPCDVVEQAILGGLPARLEDFDGAGLDLDLEDALTGAVERVDRLKRKAREVEERLLAIDAQHGARSVTLGARLLTIEGELADAEGALRSLVERKDALTGATMAARVQRALEALQQPPEMRSVPDINLALRRVFDRAVLVGQEMTERGEFGQVGPAWRWWAISFEWKHGGECLVPITNLESFDVRAGQGWRWEDEDQMDELHNNAD